MENTNTTPTPTHTDTNDNITTIGKVIISILIISGLLFAVRLGVTEFPRYDNQIIPVVTIIFYYIFGDPKFLRKQKIVKDAQTNSSDTPPKNTEKKE